MSALFFGGSKICFAEYIERSIDTYDWTATDVHIIGNGRLFVYFGSPVDEDRANISNEIYWLFLQYANDFIEINDPPTNFEYVFHFVAPGQHLQVYLGNSWLVQGNQIAFLEEVDYEVLKWLIAMRVPDEHEFDGVNVFDQKNIQRYIDNHKKQMSRDPLPYGNNSAESSIKKIENFAKEKIDGIKERTNRQSEGEASTDDEIAEDISNQEHEKLKNNNSIEETTPAENNHSELSYESDLNHELIGDTKSIAEEINNETIIISETTPLNSSKNGNDVTTDTGSSSVGEGAIHESTKITIYLYLLIAFCIGFGGWALMRNKANTLK